MEKHLQNLSSEDVLSVSPIVKRIKVDHEQSSDYYSSRTPLHDQDISLKSKEEIGQPVLNSKTRNSHNESMQYLHCETNVVGSGKPTKSNGSNFVLSEISRNERDENGLHEKEIEVCNDSVVARKFGSVLCRSKIDIENATKNVCHASSPAAKRSVPSCTDDCSVSSHSPSQVKLQNLSSNREGFWEALKVHIERPHILNRRLCGVVDVWWGLASAGSGSEGSKVTLKTGAEEDAPDLPLTAQTAEFVDHSHFKPPTDLASLFRFPKLVEKIWNILNSGRDNALPQQSEVSSSNPTLRTEVALHASEAQVKAALLENGFTGLDSAEPLAEVCSALKADRRSCFVVVRRAIPKLQERYSTVTEVVLIDGNNDCCCFLSAVTAPPLLPARPYVIRLSDCGTSTAQASSVDADAATDALNEADDIEATVPADAVAAANLDADGASVSMMDHLGLKMLPVKSCGFFQCSFIAGICKSLCGDASRGDGRVWLENTVLPRLHKWALPRETQEPPTRSLQLVDLQSYGLLYHKLKSKHAAHLIQSWSERTDPKKFVHEDIGIATYLLLLWSELPRPQRFVDLGCGNGLLVYILTKEGHIGTGYDIKRRNIWQERFFDIDLQEREVRPDTTTFSANVDWLIGNHSDELTPWIPVMAARCSSSSSFFLLPCCSYDFTTKFLRRNTSKSQYGDYLDYVSEVGQVCGFKMERDRLKIPSTKRECFVGRTRLHSEEHRPAVLASMQQFIDQRTAQCAPKLICGEAKQSAKGEQPKRSLNDTRTSPEQNLESDCAQNNFPVEPQEDLLHPLRDKSNIAANPQASPHLRFLEGLQKMQTQCDEREGGFTVRPKEQRVRNCTQLAKGVKEELVGCVVDFLLKGCDTQKEKWSEGACAELRSAAAMLKQEQLQQIKQECGGLKTLLKNHRHIFLVEGSTVRLRVPGKVPEFEKRQRPCWFAAHHPQGCPNAAADCMYCH